MPGAPAIELGASRSDTQRGGVIFTVWLFLPLAAATELWWATLADVETVPEAVVHDA